MISQIDPLNRTTVFGYNNRDRQISTTSPLGNTNRTIFDPAGNVTAQIDANNNKTTFKFDSRNRQVEVIDPLNQSTKTTYDLASNVLTTTDALNHTTTNKYDDLNRQIEVTDALNQSTKTEYDAASNVILVTDPLGQKTSYGYDNRNRRNSVTDALGKTTTTIFDKNGNVLSVTDPQGNKTGYEYPTKNTISKSNQISLVSVNSNGVQGNDNSLVPFASSDGRYITYWSGATNLVPEDTSIIQDVFVYDQVTKQTKKISKDSNGVQGNENSLYPTISGDGSLITYWAGASNLVPGDTNNVTDVFLFDTKTSKTTRLSTDNNGNQGNNFSYAPFISNDGKFVAFQSFASNLVPGDNNNQPDVFVKNIQTGETTRVSKNSNGIEGNGFSIAPAISSDGRFVAFHSTSNNLVGNDTNNSIDILLNDRQTGITTRVSTDSNDAQGNGDSTVPSISGDGRYVAFESKASNLVAGDTNGKSDVFVKDTLTGQVTRVSVDRTGIQGNKDSLNPTISADGRFVAFWGFAANLVPGGYDGGIDVYVSDRFTGDIARVSVDANGVPGDNASQSSSISADGKVITFQSIAGNLAAGDTNNKFDVFAVINPFLAASATNNVNRLGSEVNALGKEKKYTYDPVGNVTSITDRDNTSQRFTYDKLNRRTKEEWLDATGTLTRTINSTYNAAGELTNISDPDSTYAYTYDLEGKALTVSNAGTPGVPSTIMSYSYDPAGNLLSMTNSINGTTGVATNHQFDALNRLTVNTQGNKRVDYGYNAVGQVTDKKRYSDITGTNLVAETNHTYDTLNRLTNIIHSKGATNIASYVQTYDVASKIIGIINKDGTAAYTYDKTDQLTGADFNYQTDENYSYDSNGNRTNTGYITGVNNQLLEDSNYRYEYDAIGSRTKRVDKVTNEVTEYAWDIRDRLTGVTVKNAGGAVIKTANYKYDVYNERIAKTVDPDGAGALPATTERYVYGTNQNIALAFDGAGSLTHRYLFGDGIDQIEADESNGSVLWGLADHLGSVRDVIDNSGTVKNHISYDSFGNITAQTDSSVVFRYGYTGREFDEESGLYYYRSRPYDPTVGRFIQEDKIGFGGGDSNLSRYVRNRPTGLRDSRGFVGEDLGAAFGDYSAGYDVGTGYGDYGSGYDVGSAYPGGSYDDGTGLVVGRSCGTSSIFSNPNYDYENLDYGFPDSYDNLYADANLLNLLAPVFPSIKGFADFVFKYGRYGAGAGLIFGVGYDLVFPDSVADATRVDFPRLPKQAPVGGGINLDSPIGNINKPTGFPDYRPGADKTFLGFPLNPPSLGDIGIIPGKQSGITLPPFLQSTRGDTPKDNQKQNKQFGDAVREIGKSRGTPLSKDEQRRLHEEITGEGLGYKDIIELGRDLFGGTNKNGK